MSNKVDTFLFDKFIKNEVEQQISKLQKTIDFNKEAQTASIENLTNLQKILDDALQKLTVDTNVSIVNFS